MTPHPLFRKFIRFGSGTLLLDDLVHMTTILVTGGGGRSAHWWRGEGKGEAPEHLWSWPQGKSEWKSKPTIDDMPLQMESMMNRKGELPDDLACFLQQQKQRQVFNHFKPVRIDKGDGNRDASLHWQPRLCNVHLKVISQVHCIMKECRRDWRRRWGRSPPPRTWRARPSSRSRSWRGREPRTRWVPLSFPRQVGGGSEKQTVDAITSCVGFGLFADSGLLLGQLARALS